METNLINLYEQDTIHLKYKSKKKSVHMEIPKEVEIPKILDISPDRASKTLLLNLKPNKCHLNLEVHSIPSYTPSHR